MQPEQGSSHRSDSAEQTHQLGKLFGTTLCAGAIVALQGDLGAGKTTFVRGLIEGASTTDSREIFSPTYSFLNIYQGKTPVYHFDLYRLPREEEFTNAGFHEYLHAGGISCIEWADKIPALLPRPHIQVTLRYLGENQREVLIEEVR
ncbi:MAG: tRNA (adenosine(37)-N6)-threonylcarbamoyltransferase complex ATPase subunit type 1 TsaE [Chlamydiota bacterium]